MIESAFGILLQVATLYAVVGVVTAVWFFARHIKRLDPSAAGGSIGFRVLVAPGVVALWPVILGMVFRKNFDGGAGGAEFLRRNHRVAIVLLAIVGVLLFIAALVWRAPALGDLPSVKIQAP